MIVLRISSYHAALNPCFPEKQPHKMSFYLDNVIPCGENESEALSRGRFQSERLAEEKDISRRDGASSAGAPAAVRPKPSPPRHPGKKNTQAHKMTVLRISSYHAAKPHCFSEKQPHKMSFYRDNVIPCGKNERAGQQERKKISPAGTARALEGARLPVEDIFFCPRIHAEGRSAGRTLLFIR